MNTQPISITAINNHEQSTTTVPPPRLLQNPINTPIAYQGPQQNFNQYPPYSVLISPPQSPAGLKGFLRNPEESSGLHYDVDDFEL